MAGMIRVTPQQLLGVSGQLNGGASNIDTILRQLAAQVQPLGADWAGVAQVRFLELWSQWQRNAAGLNAALTQMAQLMQQGAAHYETTDSQVAGSFNQVQP